LSLEDVEPDDRSLLGETGAYGGGGMVGIEAGGAEGAASLVSGVSRASIAGVGLKDEVMLMV